jgi:hypothetical protein
MNSESGVFCHPLLICFQFGFSESRVSKFGWVLMSIGDFFFQLGVSDLWYPNLGGF